MSLRSLLVVAALLALPSLVLAQSTPAPPSSVTADAGSVSFTVSVDLSAVYPGDTDAAVMVELDGSEAAYTTRARVAMAIVVDTSGSMQGQKILDARSAATALINQLQPGDIVTLVGYSDSAYTLLANHELSHDRTQAYNAINALNAQGATCISRGLEQAYNYLQSAPSDAVRRVVLVSDGNANVGVQDSASLQRMSSSAFEFSVPTSTMGLGQDYNELLMSAVATGGGGDYYFIPNGGWMDDILTRELASLERAVTRDLRVTLTALSGVSFTRVTAVGATWSGNTVSVPIGQLAAGERRQLLFPIALPSGALGDVMETRISFTDAYGEEVDVGVTSRIVRSTDPLTVASSVNDAVVEREQVVATSLQVEQALAEYQNGNREQARNDLRQLAEDLDGLAATTGSTDFAFDAEQIEAVVSTIEEAEASPEDDEDDVVRGLWLQNDARNYEMERGRARDDMYHAPMMAE